MKYYELWLGTRKVKCAEGERREFRVEVGAPPESVTPTGYKLLKDVRGEGGKSVYSSKWFPKIGAARDELIKASKFYETKGFKVMVFFEIRGEL
nr:hypothetical protein [Candidatus Njordarchaeum guaymaensis]